MIVGGTASGKTTTLNALSSFIPEGKRIISIEDTLEVNIRHTHWVPMETAPPDQEGNNEVTMDALLKNTLRMRPDRIIVGEVRAAEAATLFTAMNTGHDGCIATIHANSARETLTRLQGHPMNVPDMMITALDLMVVQKRIYSEGRIRRVVFEVAEISGMEQGTFLTNTLFSYDPKTGKIESKILNGKIIRELSDFTGLTIKELDDEMYKRELVLELMMDYDLTQKDIHKFVQDYYKNKYGTLESLHDEIKNLKDVQKIDESEGESKKEWSKAFSEIS
jgi:flagellar protein FlaI